MRMWESWLACAAVLLGLSGCENKTESCTGAGCVCEANRDCAGALVCSMEGECVTVCERDGSCVDAGCSGDACANSDDDAADIRVVIVGQTLSPAIQAQVTIRTLDGLRVAIQGTTNDLGELVVEEEQVGDLQKSTLYDVEVAGGRVENEKGKLAASERVFHATATGKALKANRVHVTFVSELIHVYLVAELERKESKLRSGDALDSDAISVVLDQYAKALFEQDVSDDGKINYQDVLAFDPERHGAALAFESAALTTVIDVEGEPTTLSVALQSGDEDLIRAVAEALFGDAADGIPDFSQPLLAGDDDAADDDAADDDTADDDTADDDTADDDTADDDAADDDAADDDAADDDAADDDTADDDACPIGASGCSCGGNSTCDERLVCLAGLCVSPEEDGNPDEPEDDPLRFGDPLWVRLWGGDRRDQVSAIVTDSAGNVIAAGSTQGDLGGMGSAGLSDAFVCKFSPDGGLLWLTQFGSAANDAAVQVTVAPDDTIYVAGSAGDLTGDGQGGSFVQRLTPAGQLEWTWQHPNWVNDNKAGLLLTPEQDVVFAAAYRDVGSPTGDEVAVVRLNATGSEIWTRVFGSTVHDAASAAALDADGNIFVAGWTAGALSGANRGFLDVFISKLSPSGEVLWSQQVGGSEDEYVWGLLADGGGNVILFGETYYPVEQERGWGDAYLVKVTADGAVAWESAWDVEGALETASSGLVLADGSILIGGELFHVDATRAGHITRLSSEGQPEWTRQIEGIGAFYGLALGPDDAVYAARTVFDDFMGEVHAGSGDASLMRLR